MPLMGIALALYASAPERTDPYAMERLPRTMYLVSALWLIDLLVRFPMTQFGVSLRAMGPLLLMGFHIGSGSMQPWPEGFFESPWHLALLFGLVQGLYVWQSCGEARKLVREAETAQWWNWVMITVALTTWKTGDFLVDRLAFALHVDSTIPLWTWGLGCLLLVTIGARTVLFHDGHPEPIRK